MRAVVAAEVSIVAQGLQRLVVVGHWHEVQQIADQRRASATELTAQVVQYEVSVSLDIVGANGWGTYDKTRP